LKFSSGESPALGSTIIHVPSSASADHTWLAAAAGSPMSCRESKQAIRS
jgi:hypothetical protein